MLFFAASAKLAVVVIDQVLLVALTMMAIIKHHILLLVCYKNYFLTYIVESHTKRKIKTLQLAFDSMGQSSSLTLPLHSHLGLVWFCFVLL